MSSFIALKFLSYLASPTAVFTRGLIAGVVLAILRFRRLARLIAGVAVAQFFFSLGAVSNALLRPLEDEARAEAAAALACCYDAIVVLGGSIGPAMPPLRPDPGLYDSSDRAGAIDPDGSRADAPVPRRTSRFEDRIVMEGKSLNTIGNMCETRALVGTAQVALVTSAYHMPRALRLASEADLSAAAFPTDWQALPPEGTFWEYLPSVGGLAGSGIAIKEYLARAFDYRRIPAKPVS